jgi:hypothetical protein
MIRARIEYEPYLDGCRLLMINKQEGGRVVRQWDERPLQFVASGAAATGVVEGDRAGFLRFDDEELRAIYAAIGEYLGLQPQDASLLRQDYLAERARVDKVTDALIEVSTNKTIARNAAGTGFPKVTDAR